MSPIALVSALRRALETISARIPPSHDEGGGALALCSGRLRHVSSAGIALIRQFEGCARVRADGMIQAYPDPGTGGAPWTIGWGAT